MNAASKRLEDHLLGWWETATEGVHWALVTDWGTESASYENLYVLQEGDDLLVLGEDGAVAWHGTIAWDSQIRWRSSPLNPEHGQQEIGGMWVHGIQSGVEPDVWTDFFMGHELLLPSVRRALRGGPLRTVLVRRG